MNRFLQVLIVVLCLAIFIALLNTLPFQFFFSRFDAMVIWIFSALLPFRGIINLDAVAFFVDGFLLFELAWWGYLLLRLILIALAGINIASAIRNHAWDSAEHEK